MRKIMYDKMHVVEAERKVFLIAPNVGWCNETSSFPSFVQLNDIQWKYHNPRQKLELEGRSYIRIDTTQADWKAAGVEIPNHQISLIMKEDTHIGYLRDWTLILFI